MSTEQTPVEPTEIDLDTFSAELFGDNKAPKEPAKAPVEEPVEDEEVEDVEDTEEDDLAPDETDEEEEETPKPKKNSAQQRISELTRKAREAERRATDAEARMAAIEAKLTQDAPKSTAPAAVTDGAPKPTDMNADGTEKYNLGEFDPQYIIDLTRHTLKTEREQYSRQTIEQKAQQDALAARQTLADGWNAKLEPAQERYPDFMEKSEELISSFDKIDPSYGDYLTTTLMNLEFGTDVLYYLADHPAEAKKIVASGPLKATIAFGRIEAKFAMEEAEKTTARPKVSKAPTPPTRLNKGTSIGMKGVADDTDDLDAFAAKLFSRRM